MDGWIDGWIEREREREREGERERERERERYIIHRQIDMDGCTYAWIYEPS